MKINIDHIVVGAATLSQGVTWVNEKLDVDIPYGGEHLKMGTHNHVMMLGKGIFFEVIAIHPGINPPDQPRWYGLDDPYIRKLLEQEPRLLTWVVNTDNIDLFLKKAPISFGRSRLLKRDQLSWYFGLPKDGRLLASGLLPYVIQWQTDGHPAQHMADTGCRLKRLDMYHPNPEWYKAVFNRFILPEMVTVKPLSRNTTPFFNVIIEKNGREIQITQKVS